MIQIGDLVTIYRTVAFGSTWTKIRGEVGAIADHPENPDSYLIAIRGITYNGEPLWFTDDNETKIRKGTK